MPIPDRSWSLVDWLAYQERIHPRTIDLGLTRVAAVRDRLGLAPESAIITVGGTNGKGSTCAMLEAILSCAGYRVGCYTSPHLLAYNERVRIARCAASDGELIDAFLAVEAARGDTPLTYFEFGTLAAIWLFCRTRLDCVILEVGLGGRLDAVNAFDADCAIIVSVDLDHQDYLGNDVESIGREKAGIMRAGRPAIFSDQRVPHSVIDHAQAMSADLQIAGRDFSWARQENQWRFAGRRGTRHALPIPALRGPRQIGNAAGAIAALDELRDRLPVALQDVKRGLLEVELPGRLQLLPGRPAIVLDVAHNPHAARVLASGLGGMGFAQRTLAVFSMLGDKDIAGVAQAVAQRVDTWFVAPIDHQRGAPLAALEAALAREAPRVEVRRFSSVAAAFTAAREEAGADDRIVVFGSFHTVAAAMQVLATRRGSSA